MNAVRSADLLDGIRTTSDSNLVTIGSLDFYKTDLKIDDLCRHLNEEAVIDIYDIRSYANPQKIFDIHNRKYLGSKQNLLGFIEGTIMSVMGREIDSFFDCFSGTGVVAQAFRKHATRVIANDILYSNHVIHRAFISSTRKTVSVRRLDSLCEHLNSLKPVKGYAYENFADTYFTAENAAIIDSIREEIERLYAEKECTEAEKMCMLASLMYAMDKAANTVGQYDAFLKHIFAQHVAGGKHRIDTNVRKPLALKRPLIFFDGVNQAYREDAGVLASKIKADVAYIDPPYNSRQYVDCYHVLENVARWEKPPTFGKTKKFPRQGERSLFSQKRMAHFAVSSLVEALQCEHIFMSYNSEGILDTGEILDVLGKKGKVTLFEKEYPVFGNGAGVAVNRKVTERLYYCKVTQCAAKN